MSALPAADGRHLSVVPGVRSAQAPAQGRPDGDAAPSSPAPLVGYVVLVPEGTDPAELLATQGLRAEVRPLLQPGEGPAAPAGRPAAVTTDAGPVPDPAGPPGGLRVDPVRHTAEVDGAQLDLTYLEFELLAHFVAHPQRVHTRDHLVATLWGYSHIGDGRTVDVHIARLRRKLGPGHRDSIVTVRRVGYKYVPRTAE
ncbi:winged helix-turn-helix domain-containing protein [Streptomyces sp. HNM0574]|uniref:winged helix-turn-helix domain-containing protein n=1 Tax=Streptomyces sp. HNM0574 TaxID=2714954 RepID=UPI00146B2CDE|nr:winged helix-turn-helix domain-containing protein [Streptomyces sp. HNM0574]NLU65861.1 winged helix-turn-helix transcriptional regulator [Streptomyces sp. HNM0574]